jgi:hypothetical protein
LAPAITASSKTYDGTTATTILTQTLTGVLGGDVVSLTGGVANFNDKNVGNSKTVTGSGFSLTGASAANYHVSPTTAMTTANIAAKDLTVSATGVNKVYDGTTAATLNLSTDAVVGDGVAPAYTSASFANPNVGNGKAVSISGISISGVDAGNYHLINIPATTVANITQAPLTVTANNQSIKLSQPDPAYTFSYNGFVNGETSAVINTSPVCGVSVAHTTVGAYPIVCSGGSDDNYNFNFINGTLTVMLKNGADTTGVFRPSNGLLYLKNQNTTGFADVAINYGLGGDYPVVGDWNGNGDATIGVYRNGQFMLRNSNTLGFADMVFAFGQIGDQPVAGDWDGDGVDTIGVYRPSTGQFLLRNSNSAGAAEMSFYLGNVGDVGIAGDWDGDGKDTTGVFRPSNGIIFLKNTNETGFAEVALNYGIPGDKPVTGDWDYDGVDTIGVLRGNVFYLRNSNTVGFADIVFALGIPGDMPIAGNWDGQP